MCIGAGEWLSDYFTVNSDTKDLDIKDSDTKLQISETNARAIRDYDCDVVAPYQGAKAAITPLERRDLINHVRWRRFDTFL